MHKIVKLETAENKVQLPVIYSYSVPTRWQQEIKHLYVLSKHFTCSHNRSIDIGCTFFGHLSSIYHFLLHELNFGKKDHRGVDQLNSCLGGGEQLWSFTDYLKSKTRQSKDSHFHFICLLHITFYYYYYCGVFLP